MSKWFLIFLLLATSAGKSQDIDVLNYKFGINLTNENDIIRGSAAIQFLHLTNNKNILFDLTGVTKDGKGMKVTSVSYRSVEAKSFRFTQKDDKLHIELPSAIKGKTQTIRIVYQGIPDDGLIISKNKYGDRTFFADNWPNRAHHWLPCIDNPNDKATFEFSVSAPAEYDVVSNGVKEVEQLLPGDKKQKVTQWKEDVALPTKVMVIGVAKFAIKTFDDSPIDTPVSAWVYPQDSTKGFYDYALATGIVKFFSSYIAPYPYNKLANVQSKTIFGGMENASCIFYAESSVTGTRSSEDLLSHEIAHQWFGDMASEKSFAHLWLSEGFATYFTDLYFEKKYGKDMAIKRLKKERAEAIEFAKTSTHAVVDSTRDLMSLLNANSYQKGGWILHQLRYEVGDTIFQKIIQGYYNQYKGSNADTRDFEKVAEKVSGKNLKWFFDQWLYQPGLPQLSLQYTITGNAVQISIRQLQKKLYRFPLDVTIIDDKGIMANTTILVTDAYLQTTLYGNGKAKSVQFDPFCNLLFEAKEALPINTPPQ